MAHQRVEYGKYKIGAHTRQLEDGQHVGHWVVLDMNGSHIPVAEGDGEASSTEAMALEKAMGTASIWVNNH